MTYNVNSNQLLGPINTSEFANNARGDAYYRLLEPTEQGQHGEVNIASDFSINENYFSTIYGEDVVFKDFIILNDTKYYLTAITDYAFGVNAGQMVANDILGSVTFNDSLKSIGASVFGYFDNVTSYNFSKKSQITKIGNSAFLANTKLTEFHLDDNINSIYFDQDCFLGCTSLSTFGFPVGTTNIGKWAFKDCSSLKTITFANQDVNAIKDIVIADDAFKDAPIQEVLVPKGTLEAYQTLLENKIPDTAVIKDTYKPDPYPNENKTWTTGKIVGVTIGCVLAAGAIACAIAIPLTIHKKKKGNSKYKPLNQKEEELRKKRIFNKKYETGKIIEGRKCPRCGHPLMVRLNKKKHQKFIACTNYPKCTYTESIDTEAMDFTAEKMK